ncbi:MAG: diphosphate--fructose-6-phosphate 1-phosphotransferase [bacterium]|nr:diphosphate--fructose-6-phosphate 1-phosphotransferase [bacterium]
MAERKRKMGILVGGGPAPGINGVISAATIEAINSGMEVVGIYDGFKWLCQGDLDHVRPLSIGDVTRIHFEGGSVLRTARDNPTKNKETMANVVQALKTLGLDCLLTIGGDDTAFSASQVFKHTGGDIRVAHVPKTIDNDIPLPGNMPTFGFQTARHVGVQLVHNLMEDARTTGRWYFVVAMGRKAGHLTLGIGKASGATLSIIAEEFPDGPVSLDDVCTVLEGAILKRRSMGRHDGVALIAEGIGERLDPEELKNIPGVEVEYDPHGHIELREIPLATILKRKIEERFEKRGDKITTVNITMGYELRCAPPIPFDCEYVRDLGWGAVKYLLSEEYSGGAIVCLDGGRVRPLMFKDVMDAETGRTQVRLVDVHTETYQVAREYMIRVYEEDLKNPELVEKMAQAGKMTSAEFLKQFRGAAGVTPIAVG